MQKTNNVNIAEHLRISRRIDWRFLLPYPELRRVAYIGSKEGNLFNVLKMFSASLSFISLHNLNLYKEKKNQSFDLVVAHSVSRKLIKKCVSLIKPSGSLYWEMDRLKRLNFLKREIKNWKRNIKESRDYEKLNSLTILRSAKFYSLYLEQLGFYNIELNWHRPNFDACLEIIPLNDSKALNYVFSKPSSNLAGNTKLLFGRFIQKSGILPFVVPCFSIVASKNKIKQTQI